MSSDSSTGPNAELTPAEHELGMDADITRRDFLNAVALGTGAALLGTPAPSHRPDDRVRSRLRRQRRTSRGTRGRESGHR